MPVRIPALRIGLKPLAAALSAGLVAFLASQAVARLRRIYATTSGPIVVLLASGKLLRAERLVFPPGPDRRLTYVAIGMAPGEGPEDFANGCLSLAPAGDVFAISIVDHFAGGFDLVAGVRASAADQSLFLGTDNTIAPSTRWSGDDPSAPAWLVAEQAVRDADWELMRAEDPTIPRTIIEGWFEDVSTDGEVFPIGWTAAGELRLAGRTRPSFRAGTDSYPGEDLEPWWAIVGAPSGAWTILASGHGAIPGAWPAAPQPPRALDVAVVGGALLVDGVAQVHPRLDDPVIAVDGPFT